MSAAPWSRHARQWSLLGPPLRPSPEDVAIVEPLARAIRGAPPRALVLGVTPELATLPWPDATDLLGVDESAAMVAAVWPQARLAASARAVVGDWRALPVADASIDLALGDAAFTVLAFPTGVAAVLAEVSRVLRPSGRLAIRAFVPPAAREDLATIARDLDGGRVASLHALKLRILMARQASPATGAHLADAWDDWCTLAPDPEALAARLGWSRDVLSTIDVYRGSRTTYAFPTVDELDALAREAGLRDPVVHVPTYALGERCPTIVWRKG